MKHSFRTSAGTLEILFDQESRIVSAYLFDAQGRPVSAAIESWDHIDFADVLTRQIGVPTAEASEIAAGMTRQLELRARPSVDDWQPVAFRSARETEFGRAENAGVALRFVAVLLDAAIVLFPMAIVVALFGNVFALVDIFSSSLIGGISPLPPPPAERVGFRGAPPPVARP